MGKSTLTPVLLLVAGLLAPGCEAAPAEVRLEPAQVAEDLELSIDALEAALPDLYWRQSRREWKAAKARARLASRDVTDAEGLYAVLRPLASQVGEGHLVLLRPEAMRARERLARSLLPIDIHWTTTTATITGAYGDAAGIPAGTRLEAIGGEPFPVLVAELMAAFGHDGRIPTGAMREGEGKGYALARHRLRGAEEAFELGLVYPDGRRVRRIVHGVPYSARPQVPAPPDSPVATLGWPAPGVAMLRIPTFSNRRYRAAGTSFAATMQSLFDSVAAAKASAMILDLRDNGGGSEGNENLVFSYLVREPVRKYRSVTARRQTLGVVGPGGRAYTHEVFDDEELGLQSVARNRRLSRRNLAPEGLMSGWNRASPVFSGPLVVLAGGNTFSGGAELASMLAHTHRATFIGEETAGTDDGNTSGYRWDIELPNSGMTLGIPLLKFRFAWNAARPGRGVFPDIEVPPPPPGHDPRSDPAVERGLQLLATGAG